MTIDAFKNKISSGGFDDALVMLYGEAKGQRSRYLSLAEGFEKSFGERELRIFSAPGRTELCGNHTDHQAGCVLAAAVSLDMAAAVSPRSDGVVRIVSEGFGELSLELGDTQPKTAEKGRSEALIRGVAAALKGRGHELSGFDAFLDSRVPVGSGMSSSAGFEVLVGKIFSALYCGDALSPGELAKMGQWAENEYFGKPCGLMDQMACAVGGVVFVDFFEENAPKTEKIAFDFEKMGYTLCITNSGGSHADLTADYAAIPGEMRAVARLFGAETLSRVDEREFYRRLPELRGAVPDRAILRAEHFFEENRRVAGQLQNLKNGDMEGYLALMTESGRSSTEKLQNIWTAASPERSLALALAVSERTLMGEGASRVHGGGFAGTIQALVPNDRRAAYMKAMDAVFGGGACLPVRIRPVGAYELG